MRTVRFVFPEVSLEADLLQTPTADAIWDALPISGSSMTWGEEVYFSVPVSVPREADARDVMNLGEIAYWPDGEALALGYGRTPISVGDEIRLASPCNVWAVAKTDMTLLAAVGAGDPVRVEPV